MKFRPLLFLVMLFSVRCVFAVDDAPEKKDSPGIFKRTISRINIFHRDKPQPDAGDKKRSRKVELTIRISPDPLKLSEAHQMEVLLVLSNNSKSMAQLEFPTTQRFEVLLRNEAGKVINQWSENQSFSDEPGYVTLNPREDVEYSASISGRDMSAGKAYTIEAFISGHKEFSATVTIVPSR